jgi:hypothetical protein
LPDARLASAMINRCADASCSPRDADAAIVVAEIDAFG